MSVFHFDRALVRTPGRSVVGGLRAEDRGNPSYEGVLAEHAAYVAALEASGVAVEVLGPLEAFPDSVFVEDPALVFSEAAVLLRPGAASRLGEAEHLRPELEQRFDRVLELTGEGFADGGDILVTPSEVLIGLSARTDRTGAEALAACLGSIGRAARVVETPPGVLHFKTGCSLLDDETVLVAPPLAGQGAFPGLRELVTPDGEDAAANALRVNEVVFVGEAFPRTIERLEREGYRVVPLPTSEIGRIDAGLSCMSLRWKLA
jgi:dimethylargininase